MAEVKVCAERQIAAWPEKELEHVYFCPICGHSNRKKLYSELTDRIYVCAPGYWTLYQCNACGTAYLDPRPTPESISRAYVHYYTHDSQISVRKGVFQQLRHALANGYRNRQYGAKDIPSMSIGYWLAFLLPKQRGVIDALMRHLPVAEEGSILLDIGCGNGDFLIKAKGCGWDVVGVDPDPNAVEFARSRGLNVREGGVHAFDNESCKFDGITLRHVIEHVHSPLELLESCYRLLKPGGWIWLETPNLSSEGHRYFERDWYDLDPPRHLVLFTYESIRLAMSTVGFVNIEDKPNRPICHDRYTRSEALRVGDDPQGASAKHTVNVSHLIRKSEKFAKQNPVAREFVTVKALKK